VLHCLNMLQIYLLSVLTSATLLHVSDCELLNTSVFTKLYEIVFFLIMSLLHSGCGI